MCTCAYLYHIYQDRLENMKCLHSYICMCIIHLDRYQERFRWMTHTSSDLRYSVTPLVRYLQRADTLHNTTRTTDKWKHNLTCVQASLACSHSRVRPKQKQLVHPFGLSTWRLKDSFLHDIHFFLITFSWKTKYHILVTLYMYIAITLHKHKECCLLDFITLSLPQVMAVCIGL